MFRHVPFLWLLPCLAVATELPHELVYVTEAADVRPTPSGDGSSGLDDSLSGEGPFARNLVQNGSFEETDATGMPRGWRWVGKGNGTVVADSYTGSCAIKLTVRDAGGRWESDVVDLVGTNDIQVLYAVRFDRHADPHGHTDPVRVEFLAADGSVIDTGDPRPANEFSYRRYAEHHGEWFPVLAKPYSVPKGAVKVRAFCEHRDRWQRGGGPTAGWGDIFIDSVSVYQASLPEVPADALSCPYAPFAFSTGMKPPRHPAGGRRENSLFLSQGRHKDCSFFFEEESGKPSVTFLAVDLIGYRREVELRGAVLDEKGQVVSRFTQSCSVSPYSAERTTIALERPELFGAYRIVCDAYEKGQKVGGGTARYAYARRRSRLTALEKAADDYPFDIHPSAGFTARSTIPIETLEAEASFAEMLGVRGFRIQTRYTGYERAFAPDAAADHAKKLVAGFFTKVEPILKRHGLSWWPSLMEQGIDIVPRTEAEFAAWEVWHRAFAAALGGKADFVLWGNEGLGGYVANAGLDDDLRKKSAFFGTTREWWRSCHAALVGLKAGDGRLPCGPSQASDPDGRVARRFKAIAEGNFPLDCWGVNSYVNPERITASVARELGTEHCSRSFGVIPEIGNNARSEAAQVETAEMIAKTYLSVLADTPWVKRIAWFILADFDGFSLLDANYAPRPGACAYLTATDVLGAGRVDCQRILPDDGRVVLWRRRDGRQVAVGWSPRGTRVAFRTASPVVEEVDIYGNVRERAVRDGEVVVDFKGRPQYVTAKEGLSFFQSVRTAARVRADGQAIELAVKNVRQTDARLEILAEPHPFVSLSDFEPVVELPSGGKTIVVLPFKAIKPSDSRRLSVDFIVREANGVGHAASVDVSRFATEERAKNVLENGMFSVWEAEDRPVGWMTRFLSGVGGRTPPVRSVVRRNDDGFPSAPSVATVVPGIYEQVFAKTEIVQTVSLKPDTKYYFSAAVRLYARGNWPYPLIRITTADGKVEHKAVPVAFSGEGLPSEHAWRRYECSFETGSSANPSAECVLLMRNQGYGEARFDDVELFEIGR